MAFEIGLIFACLALGATQIAGETCGGNIDAGSEILSPGYSIQQDYTNDLRCVWNIKAPVGRIIRLRFSDFDLEGGDGCPNDYVTITGAAYVGAASKFCGDLNPLTIYSTGRMMTVRFHTDGSVVGRGFALDTSHVLPFETCGGIIRLSPSESDEILSPGYSMQQNYPINLDCFWTIITPASRIIELRFVDFELEFGGSVCHFDYVTITGAANVGVSTRFCGVVNPQTIYSTGNTMSVTFYTDSSLNKPGFKLEVSSVLP